MAPTVAAQSPSVTATGLDDLAAMTFSCPQAGLNAAAREAATMPSEGTYQFAYFNIISDAHHAMYEVHFKSNYEGEPLLRYCVELYCQQGWDPRTTKTTVTRLPAPAAGMQAGKQQSGAHSAAMCAVPVPTKGGKRRK